MVADSGRLATALCDAGRQVEVAESDGLPHGVPIAVFRILWVGRLQLHCLTADTTTHIFKLDDIAVFDISAQHQQHGFQFGHIDVETFIRSADGDFRREVVGVDHFKRAVDRGSGLPLGAIARLSGSNLHGALLSRQRDGVALQCGRTFHNLEADRQSRGSRGIDLERLVEDELVGNGIKLNELRSQACRYVAHSNIVEAAMRAAKEEHAIPCSRVETVAAAWSETCINTLYLRDGFKLARAAIVSKEGDRPLASVGFKVNHDFPACPSAVFVSIIEIDRHGVVGQNNTIDKARPWVLTSGDEIDATVLHGQVGVGTGSLITHRRQHNAIAVGIVADTEAGAPPIAKHVDFNLDDAARREIERKGFG